MDPTAALLAGLIAGLAIAMQVGAVSLLLIEESIAGGPPAGVAAGMGVATADLGFAAVAAAAGPAVGAVLSDNETAIRIVAAAALAAIAVHGLVAALHEPRGGGDAAAASRARSQGATRSRARSRGANRAGARGAAGGGAASLYARFLAITAANPLTIVSFAAVATALSLDGPGAVAAFVAGVGAASAAWHAVLTLAAGYAGRWITPRIQRGLAVGGRLAVLAIAAHLAFGG